MLHTLKKVMPDHDELFELLLDFREENKGGKLCEEIFRMYSSMGASAKALPKVLSFFQDIIRNEEYTPYCLRGIEIAGNKGLLKYEEIRSVFMDILKNKYLSSQILLKTIQMLGKSQILIEEAVPILERFLDKKDFAEEAAVALIRMGTSSEKAILVLQEQIRIQGSGPFSVVQNVLLKVSIQKLPLLMESLEDSDSQRRMERVLILYLANLWDRLSTQREEIERVWDTILKKLVQLKNQEIRADLSATRILEYIQKSLLRLLKDKIPQARILAEKTFLCLRNDETNRRQLAQNQGCPEGFESNNWLVQIREELDCLVQET